LCRVSSANCHSPNPSSANRFNAASALLSVAHSRRNDQKLVSRGRSGDITTGWRNGELRGSGRNRAEWHTRFAPLSRPLAAWQTAGHLGLVVPLPIIKWCVQNACLQAVRR
jgi:hypothetical protein